jgi:hypothetical protein
VSFLHRPLAGRSSKTRNRQSIGCRSSFVRAVFASIAWLLAASAVAAPDIVTLRRLDFGVLAIRTNTAPFVFSLSPLGLATYDSTFVQVAASTPGRYRLTGYPAFTDITLTISSSPVSLVSGLPAETLTVSNAITQPLTLRTNVNGQVEFDLGANLATSGNSAAYLDGVYLGLAGLTLNFDVAGVPQFTNHAIEVDAVLRTTLSLTELEQLTFGKLAVFSSASDEARLKLAPNGQVTLTNAGNAKIIRFGNETPGVFKVTTGASYSAVNITLPTSPIYLTHQSLSPDVARFLVTDFVSLPLSSNAKLDATGALEFRLGATLRTEQTAKRYQDGVYTGSYLIDVEY